MGHPIDYPTWKQGNSVWFVCKSKSIFSRFPQLFWDCYTLYVHNTMFFQKAHLSQSSSPFSLLLISSIIAILFIISVAFTFVVKFVSLSSLRLPSTGYLLQVKTWSVLPIQPAMSARQLHHSNIYQDNGYWIVVIKIVFQNRK